MDPVSALGVAAAAFQFLDVGLDALSLCKQIRDDHSGTTDTNRKLEAYCRSLQELSKDLEAGSKTSNSAGRHIRKIAKDCNASTDELLSLLQKVRGLGSATWNGAIKTAFRAMRERKTIEKLQNILKERRALLDSALVQDIRERFDKLHEDVKRLTLDLETRQKAAAKHMSDTQQDLSNIISQNEALMQQTLIAQDTTHQDIVNLNTNLQDHFADLKLESAREEILLSLFYPEHASRRQMVKPPWDRTFEWIFASGPVETFNYTHSVDSLAEGGAARGGDFYYYYQGSTGDQNMSDINGTGNRQQHQRSSVKWSSFLKWLERSDSVYWISGKAGSGKSTLVAHILGHECTRKSLARWAGNQKLHIVSFFFWRPGSSPLQRNMQGLLRSLLYQLFDDIPGLAERVLQAHPLPRGRIPAWTERNLGELLRTALSMAEECKICFFIDGLDEFEGDFDELLNIIFALQDFSHIKFCVSSRPETLFTERFSTCETLKTDQLNQLDIETFVSGKLRNYISADNEIYTEISDLVQMITRRAEGIFLWAALATQSIIRGINSGDNDKMLHERLDKLPSGMNEIFKAMLADVDAVHKRSLAFFFRAMDVLGVVEPDLNVAVIAASLWPGEITSYTAFWAWCASIEKQIVAQSRGLLQIQQKSDVGTSESHDGCQTWTLSQTAVRSGASLRTTTTDSRAACGYTARSLTDQHSHAASLAIYENKRVEWLHRSAYDFIFADNGVSIADILVLPSARDVVKTVTSAQMKLIVAAPLHRMRGLHCSLYHYRFLSLRQRIRRFIKWVCQQYELFGDAVDPILDSLWSSMRYFNNKELHLGLDHSSFEYTFTKVHPTKSSETLFWTACVEVGPIEYVQRQLESIAADPISKWILPELIQLSLQRMKPSPKDATTLPHVKQHAEFLMSALRLFPNTFNRLLDDGVEKRRRQFCATFHLDRELSIDVSWNSLQDSNTLLSLELAAVEALCKSFHTCYSDVLLWRPNVVRENLKDAELLFVDALDIWGVQTGFPSRSFGRRAKKEFFLQAPAQISLTTIDNFSLTTCMLDPKLCQTSGMPGCDRPPAFRLICNEKARTTHVITEHSHGVIIFDLALQTRQWLHDHLLDYKDSLSNSECRNLLISDVWANAEHRLDAWQQLYLLACIRTSHRRGAKQRRIKPRIVNKKKGGMAAPPKAVVFAIRQDTHEPYTRIPNGQSV